jgi:hypothetical protein
MKKRVSKCTPKKPLAVEPGPVAVAGRRGGAGGPVGVTPEPTTRKWCPLHETSLHVITAHRHIVHLVEICRECLAKCATEGVTHDCYVCGRASHCLYDCPSKVPLSEGPGSRGGGLVGACPGRDVYCGLPGRAPQDQGHRPATTGVPGRRGGGHLGDVATTNGGDLLLPRPGEVGHSTRKLAGPILPVAPLSTAGQGQHWERKRSFPEPSRPGHWDFYTAEAEICWVFRETRQALHTMWAVPYIANACYPRAVQTRVVPLTLEGPGAGSPPELPALGQASFGRSEREEGAPGNWVAHFDSAQSWEGLGQACFWSHLWASSASTPSSMPSPGNGAPAVPQSVKACWLA